jgi:hypothetical protein
MHAIKTWMGWRRQLWLVLLVGASVAFSLNFACAAPLVAFGVAAALTLPSRDALSLICGVWFADQVVGYTVIHYPWTANSLAWGAILGVAAVLGTVAAQWTVQRLGGQPKAVAVLVALLAAFTVYEGVLFAPALLGLGSMGGFTVAVIGRIFAINAGALVGLMVLNYLGMAIGLAAQYPMPLSGTRRPA